MVGLTALCAMHAVECAPLFGTHLAPGHPCFTGQQHVLCRASIHNKPCEVICCSYEETADGVTVRFSSRDGGETEYSARVLIGADGGFSGVRRQCLDDGLPNSPVSVYAARRPH